MTGRLSTAWRVAREFVVAHRKWVLRGSAGAALVFIVLLIHRSAYDLLASQPQYRMKPTARVQVAPPWSRTESVVEMPADVSLLDDAAVARVGRSFEENPWVRRVTSVERVFPDRLRVKFEARRAHAAIRRAEGVLVVDEEGVLLPGTYAAAPACARPIEIVGSTSVPPRPGTKWGDPELKAGLELIELAASTPALRDLGIKSVDVSNVNGRADRRRPETSFVLGNGCTITWGRAPSGERFGEPSPAEKLDFLAAVLKEYPKLAGLRCVKLHSGARGAVEPAGSLAGRRTNR